MKAVRFKDSHITRGNDLIKTYTFTTQNAALDLTVYQTIKADLRKGLTRKSELIKSINLLDGIDILGVNNNVLRLDFGKIDISGELWFDVELELDGVNTTFGFGKVEVRENITV